eukprot:Hpha_TRINITY_DN7754_c0_g1::TRINITY_DN7754_c0_g1_i1::g.85324::m.85324
MIQDTLERDESIMVVAPVWVRFVREYLTDVMGIRASRLIGQDKGVFARQMIYPKPMQCGTVDTAALMLLRRHVFRRLGLRWVTPPRAPRPDCTTLNGTGCANCGTPVKDGWQFCESRPTDACLPVCSPSSRGRTFVVLLAERSGKRARMPLNWGAVKERVSEPISSDECPAAVDSRTVAVPKGLPAVQQVRLFNAADLVIGPHGANLANVIWMRSGTSVVELTSYKYGNMCYYVTGSRIAVRWRFVLHSGSKDGNVTIDPGEVRRHVVDAARRMVGLRPLDFD